MKLISTLSIKSLTVFFTMTAYSLLSGPLEAQICSNSATTVYGINSSADIFPITISTASVGLAITPPYSGNLPSQANGLGYNSLNGKFYYFKRNANASPQEFVSFDPATNAVAILASCPTTNTIHTGCASADGLGYYATDVNANLYYYSVPLDTWILITSTFLDQFGVNINSVLISQNAGDLAIDGRGNLWILTSGNANFGLYKISAPLPTLPLLSILASQWVAPTTSTPSGNSFAGIAFNRTGQFILSTLNDNKLYRLENNMSLTFLGNLSQSGVGTDLTSCNFPLGVLPVTWQSFSASLKDNHNVLLTWTITQQTSNQGFYVEHSQDGISWDQISHLPYSGLKAAPGQYNFIHVNPVNGIHYYRIRQADDNGQSDYSEIRMISIKTNNQVSIWPNPARDVIRLQNDGNVDNTARKAQLFDLSGRMLNEIVLSPGMNSININALPLGTYIVRVQLSNGETFNQKLVKQ